MAPGSSRAIRTPHDEPGRWDRLREIFERACEVDPEHRDAFLERACAGDAALLEEVRELLDGDARAHSLVGRTVREAAGLS